MKYCYGCKETKPLSAFGKNRSKADGLATECRECKRAVDRIYISKNAEANRKKASDWYYANKERALEKNRQYQPLWREQNRAKHNAKANRYRAAKVRAVPEWLTEEDQKAIEVEYALASWTSEVMGEPYHVDHIVPLQGKQVCGLHVPWNLQVIPARVNNAKGNRIAI